MSTATDTFKPLSAALASGSIEEVLACLDPHGTVVVQLAGQATSLTGRGLYTEIQGLLSAFEALSLTAVSRSLADSSITEEAVFSGNHVGSWGGIEPTHRRVSFNVRLVAEQGGKGVLQRHAGRHTGRGVGRRGRERLIGPRARDLAPRRYHCTTHRGRPRRRRCRLGCRLGPIRRRSASRELNFLRAAHFAMTARRGRSVRDRSAR